MSKGNDPIRISKQWKSSTRDKQMMANYYWSIKRDLNNIEHDNQEREKIFYHNSYVHEGFIAAISLLNVLMKIVVGIFNLVFLKT